MTQAAEKDPSQRRIGLFGGSFDPVHSGHLHAARAAQAAFRLDRVIFVPAARPPHKPGRVLANPADRLALLELVCAQEPTWYTSDLEFHREGPSYTADTLRELPSAVGEAEDCELFLILGSDNLPGLPDWSRVEELLSAARPIVVFRAGVDESSLAQLAPRLSPIALERLRAGFLDLPPVEASSTAIRELRLTQDEMPLELPPDVWEYIREKGLYRPA